MRRYSAEERPAGLCVMWTAVIVVCCGTSVAAFHGPCFACELFHRQHPEVKHPNQIRLQCTYPCSPCPHPVHCPPHVAAILDGCHCCQVCAKQHGETCDALRGCQPGLLCDYGPHKYDHLTGTCRDVADDKKPCHVKGRTLKHGTHFSPNCRTNCTCNNGVYGCVSQCPHEQHTPQSDPALCRGDWRLVPVDGRCCRQWTCITRQPPRPPLSPPHVTARHHVTTTSPAPHSSQHNMSVTPAEPQSVSTARSVHGQCVWTRWSQCTATCGPGLSVRHLVRTGGTEGDAGGECDVTPRYEVRHCVVRPCDVTPRAQRQSDTRQSLPAPRTPPHHVPLGGGCHSRRPLRLHYCPLITGLTCWPDTLTWQKTRHLVVTCPGGYAAVRLLARFDRCRCVENS